MKGGWILKILRSEIDRTLNELDMEKGWCRGKSLRMWYLGLVVWLGSEAEKEAGISLRKMLRFDSECSCQSDICVELLSKQLDNS